MFWIFAVVFLVMMSRRRRWSRRWAMGGPPGYAQDTPFGWHWRHAMHDERWNETQQPPTPRPLADPDAAMIESLESRIAGLEQRLEFAERMLSERGKTPG